VEKEQESRDDSQQGVCMICALSKLFHGHNLL
jgi:hypothetical protein